MKFSKGSVLIFLTFLLLIFFILLHEDFFLSLDYTINSFFLPFENTFAIFFSRLLDFFFDVKSVFIITVFACIYLWFKHSKKASFLFAFSILSTALVVFLIKNLVQRPRPFNALVNEASFSFPSGHVTVSFVFLGLLNYLLIEKKKSKNLKIIFLSVSFFLIFMITLSRLLLNVHWFSDIIGGIILGLSLLTAFLVLFEKTKNKASFI